MIVILALAGNAVAHSWVEQVMRIALNGTLVGPVGYMRGYVGRMDPGFADPANTYLLPPNGRQVGNILLPDDAMCATAQRTSNYSTKYPMLSAAPGDFIALRYQENGHVSLPEGSPGKPQNRGTIYVYGTSTPSKDEKFLGVHGIWAKGNASDDAKGHLIAKRNFDDGQCYQINDGPISAERQAMVNKQAQDPQGADLWCQADLRLPADLPTSGTYTLYWVWDWPTISDGLPASGQTPSTKVVSPQIYTSCLDIQLTPNGISNDGPISFNSTQDANSRAIEEQLEDNFAPASDQPKNDSGSHC
jgi:hypothetical protein